MIKKCGTFAVLTLIGLMLGACAAAPVNSPATPSPEPTAPPMAEDVMVIFHKSGGIAGIDETLTVHRGGLLEFTDRAGNIKSLKVNEPELLPLNNMLTQKEFGALEPLYQASGADLFVYTITARGVNGETRSVTTMDGAKTPAYLGQLIGMLEQLRAIVSKNG